MKSQNKNGKLLIFPCTHSSTDNTNTTSPTPCHDLRYYPRQEERKRWLMWLADRESENQSTALLSLSPSPMLAVFLKYNWKGLMTSPEVMKHVLEQTPTQMADKTVRPVPTCTVSRAEKPTSSQCQQFYSVAGGGGNTILIPTNINPLQIKYDLKIL